jgi:hypothetical protein
MFNENIDMIRFKKMLVNGEIDIEPLKQCLKQEMDDEVPPESSRKMFGDN